MQTCRIALLAGGLLIGAGAAASAQQLAAAVPPPQGELRVLTDEVVVFTGTANSALSPTALAMVRAAAHKVSPLHRVTLTGRPENVASVKALLMREGVPANRIVTRHETGAPLPKAPGGIADPLDRRVEIRL